MGGWFWLLADEGEGRQLSEERNDGGPKPLQRAGIGSGTRLLAKGLSQNLRSRRSGLSLSKSWQCGKTGCEVVGRVILSCVPQTTLSNQGLVAFPEVYLIQDELQPGETFDVERTNPGEYTFRREEENSRTKGSTGLTDTLLQFQRLAP